MIQFACRYCGRSSEIDRFRSKYPNVCLDCYRRDSHRRALLPQAKYSRLKYNAKKAGLPMKLTRQQFDQFQTMDCTYCGFPVTGRSLLTAEENTGSGLDRKDSTKGYVIENVVPACFLCNRTKNCWFSYDEMLIVGKTIRRVLDARTSRG